MQTAFQNGTPSSAGAAYKPNLSVLAIADGTSAFKSADAAWPVGTLVLASYVGASANGATQPLFDASGAYVAVGAGSTTLQNAYENGNQIATDATGDVIISGSQKLSVSAAGGIIANKAGISETLDVSGDVTFLSHLDASGAYFAADISGQGAQFAGLLDASQALVRNDLDVSGTLSVSGLSDFSGATFTADISGTKAHFSDLLDASAALIHHDLDVSGNADISGDLGVIGTSDFSGSMTAKDISGQNLDLAQTLSVGGLADFSGALVHNDLDVSGDLSVVGASDFSGAISAGDISGVNMDLSSTLSVAGLADFSGVLVYNDLDVSGSFDLSGAAILRDDLSVHGNADISGTLDVSGIATFAAAVHANSGLDVSGAALTVYGGAFEADLSGNIFAQGNADISGALAVDGKAQFKEQVGTLAKNYTGSTIVAGTICCAVGGARGIKPARADDAVAVRERRFFGVAIASVAESAEGFVASVPGTYVEINLDAAASGTAGDLVYLSETDAGKATLAAPTAAGNAVVQIGYLAEDIAAATVAEIVIAPQFIAQIPA